jgi:tetratricopeptide (TPR) repeat protein
LLEEGTTYQNAGMLDKAFERFRQAASIAGTASQRVHAIRRQADVLRTRCEWDEALRFARRAQEIAEEADLKDALAESINSEAAVYHARGEHARALELYERMLQLTTDARVRGVALQNLGTIAALGGDHTLAESRFRDSFRAFREAGYERGMTMALNNYGRSALESGSADLAESLLHRAERLALVLNDFDLANMCMLNRAEAMLARRAYDEADELVSRAIGHFGMTNNQWRRLECLRLLGDIDRLRGNESEARAYYSAALTLARHLEARVEVASLEARLAEQVLMP